MNICFTFSAGPVGDISLSDKHEYARNNHRMHAGLYKTLTKIEMSRQAFIRNPNIKLKENDFSSSRVVSYIQIDNRTVLIWPIKVVNNPKSGFWY
jgi:hypothetical protein